MCRHSSINNIVAVHKFVFLLCTYSLIDSVSSPSAPSGSKVKGNGIDDDTDPEAKKWSKWLKGEDGDGTDAPDDGEDDDDEDRANGSGDGDKGEKKEDGKGHNTIILI